MKRLFSYAVVLSLLLSLLPLLGHGQAVQAAASCAAFPTGLTVCEPFLSYWQTHGGLAQQGYPISPLFTEKSSTDEQLYKVQYFERAVFEYHPEYKDTTPVLLSQLGRTMLQTRYSRGTPPVQADVPAPLQGNCAAFAETGQQICGLFRSYWEQHGGLTQQGFPLTGVLSEKSAVNGQTYLVQYFERAVFEYHPENATPNDVLLSLLGTLTYAQRWPNGPDNYETDYLTVYRPKVQTIGGNYVDWTILIRNSTGQPLLSVLFTVVFYDANGNTLDTTIGGATNLNPFESRTVHGLSIKGVGYASYQVRPPEVLLVPPPR